jgi:excisionase family DNA binding protein
MPVVEIDRDRFLTVTEAAERSGYKYDTIRALVRKKLIASIEIAPRVRLVDWQSLQAHMVANEGWRASRAKVSSGKEG